MKKKIIAITLALLTSFPMPIICKRSIEEYGVMALGAYLTWSGFDMLKKSVEKDGTKKQAIFGSLLTLQGLCTVLIYPGKIRGVLERNGAFNLREGESLQGNAIRRINSQLHKSNTPLERNILLGMQWAIQNDGTGFSARVLPWADRTPVKLS